ADIVVGRNVERAALNGCAAGVIAGAAEHDGARARNDDAADAGALIEIGRIRPGLVADRAVDRGGLAAGLAGAEGDALIALQEDARAVTLARSRAARTGAAGRATVGERAATDRQCAAALYENITAGAEATASPTARARSAAITACAAVATLATGTTSAAGAVSR